MYLQNPLHWNFCLKNSVLKLVHHKYGYRHPFRKISSHHGKFLTGSMVSTSISSVTDKCDAKLPVVYLCEDNNERRLVPYELVKFYSNLKQKILF